MLGGVTVLCWHIGEPFTYDVGFDEAGVEQCRHEVSVLLAQSAQLRDAEVLFFETPAGVPRTSGDRGGVGVLDFDQPVALSGWEDGSLQVHPVDVEAVLFFERRPLAGDSFNQIGKSCSFAVVVTEGKDVDLGRHGRFGGKLVLGEGTEDGLRSDNDHGVMADDLASGPDRMLELVAAASCSCCLAFTRLGGRETAAEIAQAGVWPVVG